MPVLSKRLDQIRTAENLAGLADLTRGVEKESLRVSQQLTYRPIVGNTRFPLSPLTQVVFSTLRQWL